MSFKRGDRVVVYDTRLKGGSSCGRVLSTRDPNGLRKPALFIVEVARADAWSDEIIVHPFQVRKQRGKK